MAVARKKPVFLNLFTIKLPVTGVVSIVHRITGVLLAITVPALIYFLDMSLRSEASFKQLADWLSSGWLHIGGIVLVWALAHHLFAGIRHLLLDLDVGISKAEARRSAWIVHTAAVIVLIIAMASLV